MATSQNFQNRAFWSFAHKVQAEHENPWSPWTHLEPNYSFESNRIPSNPISRCARKVNGSKLNVVQLDIYQLQLARTSDSTRFWTHELHIFEKLRPRLDKSDYIWNLVLPRLFRQLYVASHNLKLKSTSSPSVVASDPKSSWVSQNNLEHSS